MAENVIVPEDGGLLADEVIADIFRGYPLDVVRKLRQGLLSVCPSLKEKANKKSRYLGYARGNRPASLFIYVQKKGLLWDVRVPPERGKELERMGFEIRPRDNFQAKAGWLTGLIVPHDTEKLKELEQLALDALQR